MRALYIHQIYDRTTPRDPTQYWVADLQETLDHIRKEWPPKAYKIHLDPFGKPDKTVIMVEIKPGYEVVL